MSRVLSRRAAKVIAPGLLIGLIVGGCGSIGQDGGATTSSVTRSEPAPTELTFAGGAPSTASTSARSAAGPRGSIGVTTPPSTAATPVAAQTQPPLSAAPPSAIGHFTVNFAGDVNFADRTADRLAADPATVFGAAAPGLAAADLTVVNLETAITDGGTPEPKAFTFRAPPSALTALRSAGVDVATMANNHGADYGEPGLRDSIAAIEESRFPVIGIGARAAAATAPYRTTINGVDVVLFAASAVHDRTLAVWTAGSDSPGIASAFDPALVAQVGAAAATGATVLVYLHWGTEYVNCPDDDQLLLADQLAAAGATAVVGTHAHVLQGAGWRPDGSYIAYGLGNYLWWRSFGNDQDDNGVLTLTIDGASVTGARFAPARLDDTGVPVPASGAERERTKAAWDQLRGCADLSAAPPR